MEKSEALLFLANIIPQKHGFRHRKSRRVGPGEDAERSDFVASKKNKKSKAGRPSVITDAVVGKLELGFSKGLNKTECCRFAGISRDSLYAYLEKNPKFSDRIEELQSHPSMKAKINIADRIEKGDIDLSQWYLERKCRDEFSLKQEVAASVNAAIKLEDLI